MKLACAAFVLAVLILPGAALAQGFKVYPGAKLDPKASEEARKGARAAGPGMDSSVYLTNDAFEKVVAFYKGFAKELQMPVRSRRMLPNGQQMKQAFFLFDGAGDLMSSKHWAKIQRPYIGSGATDEEEEIRDVTVIQVVQKK